MKKFRQIFLITTALLILITMLISILYKAIPIGLLGKTVEVGDMQVKIDISSDGDNGPYTMTIFVDEQLGGQFSGDMNLDFFQDDYPGYYRYAWIDGDLKLDLVIEPSDDAAHYIGTQTGEMLPLR